MDGLEKDLFDTLMLTELELSVAVLFGTLVGIKGYPRSLDVSSVIQALDSLEERGWVRALQMTPDGDWRQPTQEDRVRDLSAYQAWLPSVDLDYERAFAIDEIGLWYEVTENGLIEWRRRHPGDQPLDTWQLDDDMVARRLSIHAASIDVAEAALKSWQSDRPNTRLKPESRRLEKCGAFELGSGSVISNGYELTYEYEEVDNG